MFRILCALISALLLMGCVSTHPKDLELVAVRVMDNRLIAELPAAPSGKRSLINPYRDYLLDLRESKQEGERITPTDIKPYFAWYSKNKALQKMKTEEPVLKVEFSSQTSFSDEVSGSGQVISIHQYFCSRPNDAVLLGPPGVYIQGLEVASIFEYDIPADNDKYIYYSFVDVFNTSKKPSSYIDYDLRESPEDVCFQVRRKAMGFGYKSNVVVVPAEAITAALKKAGVEAIDSTL